MNNATGQNEIFQNILSNMGLSVMSIEKMDGKEVYEIVIITNNNEDSYILNNGKVKKSILPKGYKECEYIEATGTQYINTNIKFEDTTEFYLKCSFNTTNQQWNGIGHDDTNRFMMGILNNKFSAALGNIKSTSVTADNRLHEFLLSNKNKKFCIDNDEYINFDNRARILDGKEVIGIGARLSGNFYYCNEKIYSAKIYKNNILEIDLIPCLDDNNIACMYDNVTKSTFYNCGSGDFLYELK